MKKLIMIGVLVFTCGLSVYAGTIPQDPMVTRGEFVQTLMSQITAEMNEPTGMPFQDVKATDSGYADILKAHSLGYITGTSEGLFKPGEPITREEMAAILSRVYCKASRIDKTQLVFTAELLYKDQGGVSDWARTDIKLCYSLGLLKKDNDGYIRPKASALHSEAIHGLTTLQWLLTKN